MSLPIRRSEMAVSDADAARVAPVPGAADLRAAWAGARLAASRIEEVEAVLQGVRGAAVRGFMEWLMRNDLLDVDEWEWVNNHWPGGVE